MIEIVEGRGVGSGKSYYVLTRVADHLAVGGTVCVTDKFQINFAGLAAYISHRYGVQILPEQWRSVPGEQSHLLQQVTPQGTDDCPVLIVLDESQDSFNSRDFKESGAGSQKRQFFSWLCQSRHDSNDLIFITQNALNIDVQIRRLTTYITRVRNMVNFTVGGMQFPFRLFCVNRYDGDGKTFLKREWLSHDKRVFNAYVSKSQKGAHQRDGTVSRFVLKPVKKSKMKFLLTIFVVALVCIGVAAYRYRDGSWIRPVAVPAVVGSVVSQPAIGAAPRVDTQHAKPAYRIIERVLRATDGATYMRTDGGEYATRTMSVDGWCEGVSGSVAVCRSPYGELIYVIGGASRVQPGVERVSSQVAVGPPVVQTVFPPDSMPADEARSRRANAGIPESDAESVAGLGGEQRGVQAGQVGIGSATSPGLTGRIVR